MIVITRNGKTTVVTGWRAWLLSAAAVVGVTAVLLVLVFVMLGMAVTVTAILLVAVPALISVALVASLIGSGAGRR